MQPLPMMYWTSPYRNLPVLPPRHGTSLYSFPRHVETCLTRTSLYKDTLCPLEKFKLKLNLASGWFPSYWNAFLLLIVLVFQTVVVQTGLSRPPSYLWLSCLVYWCCNCVFGGIAFALSSNPIQYNFFIGGFCCKKKLQV